MPPSDQTGSRGGGSGYLTNAELLRIPSSEWASTLRSLAPPPSLARFLRTAPAQAIMVASITCLYNFIVGGGRADVPGTKIKMVCLDEIVGTKAPFRIGAAMPGRSAES